MCWRPRRTCGMCCRCGDMMCAALYTGGCGAWALFAGGIGGVGDAGGDALYATLYAGGAGVDALDAGGCEGGLCLLEVPEVMRCVLLCMLEAVEGGFYLLKVLKVLESMRWMLEAVEGGLCLREALEVLEMMRCVLLCMLEAVEGELYLLEVLESMRWMLEVVRVGSGCWRWRR